MPIPLIAWAVGAAAATLFANGCSDKKGSQGPKGDKGDPGANGKDGIPGPKGEPGKNGTNGKDGLPGQNGASCTVSNGYVKCGDGSSAYVIGSPGPSGDKGDTGANGKDGTPGPKGEPGNPACMDPTVTPCMIKNGSKLLALGDGKNNDQPALQCTIDALASKGGGTVCLPQGVFRLEDRLSLRGSGLTLFGKGSRNTVLWGQLTQKAPDGNDTVRVDGNSQAGFGPTIGFRVAHIGLVGSGDYNVLTVTNGASFGEINQVAVIGGDASGVYMDVCGGIALHNVAIGNGDLFPAQFANQLAPMVGIKVGSESSNIVIENFSATATRMAGIQIIDLDPGSSTAPANITIVGGNIRMPKMPNGEFGISIEGSSSRTTGPITVTGLGISMLYGGVEEKDVSIQLVRAENITISGGWAMAEVSIRHSVDVLLNNIPMYGLRVDKGVTGTPNSPYSMGIRVSGGSVVSVDGIGKAIINKQTQSDANRYLEWGLRQNK